MGDYSGVDEYGDEAAGGTREMGDYSGVDEYGDRGSSPCDRRATGTGTDW